jgi:viroplasmin and RNaseH domain-containing protein
MKSIVKEIKEKEAPYFVIKQNDAKFKSFESKELPKFINIYSPTFNDLKNISIQKNLNKNNKKNQEKNTKNNSSSSIKYLTIKNNDARKDKSSTFLNVRKFFYKIRERFFLVIILLFLIYFLI